MRVGKYNIHGSYGNVSQHTQKDVCHNAPEFCKGCHVPKEATTNWYLEFPEERSSTMMPTGTVTRNCQTWNLATQRTNTNKKTTSYWNSGWIIQHQPTKSKNIHPRNLTYPLKNDGWKMSFLLGLPIFRGYVKFPGCTEKQRKMWHSFGQIQRIDLSITSSAWTRVERVSWPNSWDSFWLQVFFVQSNIPF